VDYGARGEPTESTVAELGAKLSPRDTIIDGGNSFFKDDVRAPTSSRPARSSTSTPAPAAASVGSSAATA
jgi:hypothetical protein